MHPDHPESPETKKWLAELRQRDPRRYLVALLAMSFTFDFLRRDPEWEERLREAREALKPTSVELEEIYDDVAHLLNVARDELETIEREKVV
jgi:hypothetical protein